MKKKIEDEILELTNLIQIKELEFSEVLKDAPEIISILESGFENLKHLISDHNFLGKSQEIHFFKTVKPGLFCKLIYYQKIYHIELKRPISGYQTQKDYLEKELENISRFSTLNADFIQYYRSGKTMMDEFYFLRGKRYIELNQESFYFERDAKFSTPLDFKVSKLLANDMLAAYINCELVKLRKQENNLEPFTVPTNSQDEWTDKKVALAELIYAIHEEKSINFGNIHLKVLAAKFGKIFNVDMSDLYNMFLEIRGRKIDRTEYLNRLIKALNRRMDEADSK